MVSDLMATIHISGTSIDHTLTDLKPGDETTNGSVFTGGEGTGKPIGIYFQATKLSGTYTCEVVDATLAGSPATPTGDVKVTATAGK